MSTPIGVFIEPSFRGLEVFYQDAEILIRYAKVQGFPICFVIPFV